MCGRFTLDDHSIDIAAFFKAEDPTPERLPTFSMAHSGLEPLVRGAHKQGIRQVLGAREVSTVMVTREALEASNELQERVPTFRASESWDLWLTPVNWDETEKGDAVVGLTAGMSQTSATKSTHEIAPKVNNSETDPTDASLLDAVHAS